MLGDIKNPLQMYHWMMSEAPTVDNEVFNHNLTSMTPTEIAEHLKQSCPEFRDLNVEEVLLLQESAFLSFESNKQKDNIISNRGETSNDSLDLAHESESQIGTRVERQVALDEDFARALELEDDLNNLYVHEHDVSAADNADSTFRETRSRGESQNIRQDEIDPDRMTYEELQSLGESVGAASRGLSAELISQLPTYKYKAKKKKKEEERCVMCYAEYKNGAELIILPCAHQYHSGCITPWLEVNKKCPVCQNEVQDE